MGKQPTPAFFKLSIFVMLLYSAEMSTAAALPSILSVMNSDKELCNTPMFLYESEATKRCAKVNYPSDNVALNHKDPDIFLCLGVYDAGYKLCRYSNHWRNPFNNTAAFNSYIEKFARGADTDRDKFCQTVKDIKPMYEKIKPPLSWFMNKLNNTSVCQTFCFELEDKFNPLCAVLAWIKSVDIEVETESTVRQDSTIVSSPPVKKVDSTIKSPSSSQSKNTDVPGMKTKIPNDTSNPAEQPNAKILSNEKVSDADSVHPAKVIPDEHKVLPKEKPSKSQNDASQPTLVAQPKAELPKTQISMAITNAPSLDPRKDESAGDVTAPDDKKTQVKNNPLVSTIKAVTNDSPKVSIDDVKTSTISEHTQDGNESNDGDYPMEGERLSFGEADQPTDMSDQNQNQNIPEPSEQRDILPRYNSRSPEDESHFFAYFTVVSMVCVAMYIGNHYKQKIIAIVLEGRRSRNNRGRRRPSTASYRKLDCTLEEAVTSQCSANVTHVIY